MNDPTENTRRKMAHAINTHAGPLDEGQEWTTEELTRDFTVESFAAPFVVVTRKSDGVRGTLYFRHSPRTYFNFQEA